MTVVTFLSPDEERFTSAWRERGNDTLEMHYGFPTPGLCDDPRDFLPDEDATDDERRCWVDDCLRVERGEAANLEGNTHSIVLTGMRFAFLSPTKWGIGLMWIPRMVDHEGEDEPSELDF